MWGCDMQTAISSPGAGLSRNLPCWHPGCESPVSRLWENRVFQALSVWDFRHGVQSWWRQWPLSVYSCAAEVLFICFSWGFLFCFTYIKFTHALIIRSLKCIKCFLSISWDGHVWPVTLANDVIWSQSWIPEEPSSVLGCHPLYINTPCIHTLHTCTHACTHHNMHTHHTPRWWKGPLSHG